MFIIVAMDISREKAVELFKKYNKSESLYHHALSVEAVMREFAGKNNEDQDFWGIAGLLHDVDFEKYPEEHCKKAPELLAEVDAEPELVHAICSHGYGLCSDVKPEHEMEKVLFAADELTGIVFAAAKMRPSRSCRDMELSSLKKKFKDKRFAAGCSREVIRQGAENLGWELDTLLQKTLTALQTYEEEIREEMEKSA